MEDIQAEIDRAWSDYNAAMAKLRPGMDIRQGAQGWENKASAAWAVLTRLGAVPGMRRKYVRGEFLKQVR